jgi:hypothetical protein
MKLKQTLLIGACAAFAFTAVTSQTAFAAEHEKGEKAEKMVMPETVDGIMAEIHKHHGELADVVKAKKLADVHHHAFAIRDLANGLPAKVAADKKARVDGSVKNIAKLAEDLDKTGDDNNQAATEANLKKLDGVLMVLEKQVK